MLAAVLMFGCSGGDDGSTDDGGPVTGCTFESWDVTADRLLTKSCSPYTIDDSVEVHEGATLTVEAGVELRLRASEWIRVGEGSAGAIDLQGTVADPIVVTTSGAANEGAWFGIILAAQTTSAKLANTTVRYGGRVGFGVAGCVTSMNPPDGALQLDGVTFEGCAQSGLSVEGGSFTATDLSFTDCESGMFLDPNVVGSVGETFTYDDTLRNRMREGDVLDTATWVTQGVPYAVEGSVEVAGPDTPVLTLGAGLELAFDSSEWLRIGDEMAATLVVAGAAGDEVIVRGKDSSASAGDWFGVLLGNGTRATTIDYLDLRHGGRIGFGVGGCLTIYDVAAGEVAITNSRFSRCKQSGVSSTENDRFRFSSFDGNTFEDSDSGMWLSAGAVGSVAADQTFTNVTENLMAGADVLEDTTWRRQPVPWAVQDDVGVQGPSDPVLTVEAGGRYVFDASTWLQVAESDPGGLVVAGTATEPVIFEADNAQAGAWFGIKLESGTLANTSFDYAIVRHGGRVGFGVEGCLTVEGPSDGRVAIRNSTFASCNEVGVGAESQGVRFAEFTGNTFEQMEVGYAMHANTIGDVAAGQTFDSIIENRILEGDVEDSATWAAQTVAYFVESVEVQGPADPVLTLAAGLRLRFDSSDWLRVGVGEDGGLQVAGTAGAPVRMVSNDAGANGGEWFGLFLGPATLPGTSIDYLELRHAGRVGFGVQAGLTLDDTQTAVSISNSTFADNDQADVYVDCNSAPTLVANAYGSAGGLEREGCGR